jgi:hypothetical protein
MGSISIQAANVYIEHQPYLNGKRTRYEFDDTTIRATETMSVSQWQIRPEQYLCLMALRYQAL